MSFGEVRESRLESAMYGLNQAHFLLYGFAHLERFTKNCQGQRLVGNFQIATLHSCYTMHTTDSDMTCR